MGYLDASGITRLCTDLKQKFADKTHSHTVSDVTDFPSIPSNTSDLNNDSGFLTSSSLVVDTKTASSASTISGGAYQSINVTVTKTGYTPVGIVGVAAKGANSGACAVVSFYLSSSTNAVINVRNVTTSSATYTPDVYVLYMKD